MHAGPALGGATRDHPGDGSVVEESFDPQRDGTVADDHPVAHVQVGDERVVIDVELADRAGPVAGAQHHLGALHQMNTFRRQLPGADLRAGQIGEDGDDGPHSRCRSTHIVQTAHMFIDTAVGEVEAHHVDTGHEQPVEHLGRLTGRAERGDDLGSGLHRHHSILLITEPWSFC